MSRNRNQNKKKSKIQVTQGQVHVCATFNNTIITVTDTNGNTLSWSSAGNVGFKGSRKSTVQDVKLPYVHFPELVCVYDLSQILHQFHITDAVHQRNVVSKLCVLFW